MQSISNNEQSVRANLTQETRKIVHSQLTSIEKVRLLQKGVSRHTERISKLRNKLRNVIEKPSVAVKILRMIDIRSKCANYLRAMARYLMNRENHDLTLQQEPRYFAENTWKFRPQKPPKKPEAEIPFMDFSS